MRYLTFLLLILVPILGIWTFVTAPSYGWWFPEEARTTYGPAIDNLFYWIAVPIVITFIGTEVVLAWSVLKYSSPRLMGSKGIFSHGSHKLELIWTAIPAVVLVLLAFTQMSTFAQIKFERGFPDDGPYSIERPIGELWASQFDWRARYPDANGDLFGVDAFESSFQFVVPADTGVVFNLRSRDVLHSFFVPAFRLKQDAVPGMTIPVWFEASIRPEDEEQGYSDYDLICAELCGWGHYKMAGQMRVMRPDLYDAWVAEQRASLYSNGEAD